ncbi:MAG: ABC transporter permease [Clostridiales bacterium]|nr:ABC transporter permease [Clostridiales bacterium]
MKPSSTPPGGTAFAQRSPAEEGLSQERREYLRQVRRQRQIITISRIGLLILFLGLWELGARMGWIDSFIMSSPSRILETMLSLADNQILLHLSVTLYETLTGFTIGAFGGVLLAVLLWQSELLSRVLEPYLVVLNSLPKIALGPVIIIWVGAGTKAIVVMAVAISMIVTVLEMLEGFNSTDPELIKMSQTFGASRRQVFQKIVFPANISTLFASLKINIGLSLVGVIAGEFLISKAGLGYLIVYGGQVFQLDLVMTGVIILALMAVVMYRCITLVEHLVLGDRKK